MHDHICPRCGLKFEHERTTMRPEWSEQARLIAMHLHRFYGCCQRCLDKYINEKFGGSHGTTTEAAPA
jgi:hypothetical protein